MFSKRLSKAMSLKRKLESHSEKKSNAELMDAAKLSTTAQVSANKNRLILKERYCFISICKIKVSIYSTYYTR